MMQKSLMIILLALNISCLNAANILFLNTLPSRSHTFWNAAIANALESRGHNITMIAPDIDKNPPAGLHYIHIENSSQKFHEMNKKKMEKTSINPFVTALKVHFSAEEICMITLKSNGFRTLLNYPSDFKFDLVLYDFTLGPCLLPFLDNFNYPPLVAVTAFSHPSFLFELVGGHQYYAYVPHNVFLYENDMNFWQRSLNLAVYLEEYLMRKYYFHPRVDALVAKYLGAKVPSVEELQKRTLIALINTNSAIDYAEPLPENVIPIGGVHVKDAKPLPIELEHFINSSGKGVVAFSLGTNVHSDFLTIEKQKIFIETFRQLPQYNFLWKYDNTSTPIDLPPNLRILNWLPQSDIFAHEKIKAIIAHGGSLSTQEAIYRGVPLLVIPFVYDQIRNAVRMKKLGVGDIIDYHTVTETEFKTELLNIMENPKYAAKAKLLSKRFRDQKEKPLDRAVFWIEWALRNPDADYMKSPVLRLGVFVGNSFDVIASLTLLIAVALIGTLWFVKKVCYIPGKGVRKIKMN